MKYIFVFLLVVNVGYFFWINIERVSWPQGDLKSSGIKDSSSSTSSDLVSINQEIENLYQVAASAHSPVPSPSLCVLVGPFESLLYAEYFQENLAQHDVVGEIHHLPANKTLYELTVKIDGAVENPVEVLYQLRERNLEGFIVGDKHGNKKISLGRFVDPEALEDRRLSVEAMSLASEINQLESQEKIHWVEIKNQFAEKLNGLMINGALVKKNYIEIKQNVCLGIANN